MNKSLFLEVKYKIKRKSTNTKNTVDQNIRDRTNHTQDKITF